MDLLSSILNVMKLSGSLYFRTSFTSPWGVEVPAHENVSRFHYVHSGQCYAQVANQREFIHLEQGDLIIITRGATHKLSDPKDSAISALDFLLENTGYDGRGALTVGNPDNGHETQLICGQFAFDPGANHVLLDSLPDFVHVKDYGKASPDWLDSTLKLISAEMEHEKLGVDLITMKLSEIIFTQAVRYFIENDGSTQTGLAGFADKHIRSALVALHERPGDAWSVEDLAKIAGMSRTSFSNKFSELIGSTPLSYLTEWRMQLARQMLIDTEFPIIDIALKSGYQSEAAFGRVFKRYFQKSPAEYRRSIAP